MCTPTSISFPMHAYPQVKAGTIFDNILITDDEDYATEFGEETWGATKDPEKKMKEEVRLVSTV